MLLRTLQDRDVGATDRGRIAVGWLIVEDLAMVIAQVLVPPFSQILGGLLPAIPPVRLTLGLTILKVAAFVVLMQIVGRRIIPALLHHVASTGSRELFRLAVQFFVSVGVLFDPGILVREPLAVIATVAAIVLVKSLAADAIVRVFGHDRDTDFTISASLAQIGEFSFILIVMGVTLGIVPQEAQALVVAESRAQPRPRSRRWSSSRVRSRISAARRPP